MSDQALEWALPRALPPLVSALAHTWRLSLRGEHNLGRGPRIFVLWHGRMLALAPLLWRQREPVTVLVGPMRDARIIGATLEALGAQRALGATGPTGARGLVALARRLQAGEAVCLAVDGPAGPSRQARSGAVALARRSGAPIIPLGAACAAPWVWPNSWDDFWIPPPGARLELRVGRPLWAPPGPRRAAIPAGLAALQRSLEALNP
jgi:lysophospholipid acyltransferase (LPLAT)-like uncharacterized protein